MLKLISDSDMNNLFPKLSTTEKGKVNEEITKLIYNYCNTTFEPVNREGEKYDSSSGVILEHRPIISVVSVVDDGRSLNEDAETNGFFVYKERIVLTNPSRKRKALRVTYTSGHVDVPPLAKSVALELARYRVFQDQQKGTLFYKSQRMEERDYEIDEDMSELKILSKLYAYVQPVSSSLKRGSGPIRLGVM